MSKPERNKPCDATLCKIHHGAFDNDILGISADYRVAIKTDVLETFDGPTLQHALKEMHGARFGQLPVHRVERPDREPLDERFQRFLVGTGWFRGVWVCAHSRGLVGLSTALSEGADRSVK